MNKIWQVYYERRPGMNVEKTLNAITERLVFICIQEVPG